MWVKMFGEMDKLRHELTAEYFPRLRSFLPNDAVPVKLTYNFVGVKDLRRILIYYDFSLIAWEATIPGHPGDLHLIYDLNKGMVMDNQPEGVILDETCD